MRTLACTVALLFGSTVNAAALPGQTLAQFLTWSNGVHLLHGVARYTDELSGQPAFKLDTADHGIDWHFVAYSLQGRIYEESLRVGQDAGGALPVRHNGSGYGFTFFRSLYGPAVASDFRSSHLLGTVTDATSRPPTPEAFYRGSRFGYEVIGDGILVVDLARLVPDLRQARTCAAHPERCSE